MALWEWIPGVKIIGHLITPPPGSDYSDYIGCAPTQAACSDPTSAILACNNCVSSAMSSYVADWFGVSLPKDAIAALAGGVVAVAGNQIAKALGGKFLGLAATAWTGVGAVILVLEMIDAVVVIAKAFKIYNAAQAAKVEYCKCG